MLGVLWYFATIVAAGIWVTGSPLGRLLTAAELVRGVAQSGVLRHTWGHGGARCAGSLPRR